MTNFLELARSRYSVRNYLPREVEEEKLNYILECGRVAPSAANYQPWQIIVVRDAGMRARLADTYNREWFRQAPVILVFLGNHQEGWKRGDGKDHTDIDIAIIADHITLAAAEQGLGTCWICNFNSALCSGILGLPADVEPVAYLSLGYPAVPASQASRQLKRKSIGEIVKFDRY